MSKFKAVLVMAAVAVSPRPVPGQSEVELQDSGLTFTIRNIALQAEGSKGVFRGVLDNRTQRDWYMRAATITVNATCEKGLQHLTFTVHFTNSDLATSALSLIGAYTSGSSIKPGENSFLEPLHHADPTCKFDSLGPVRSKGLKPVDDTTQKSLDADRGLRRTLDELKAVQPTLDRLRQDEADRRPAFCHTVYTATAKKKISDLTVTEAQQVQACQPLGYYQ